MNNVKVGTRESVHDYLELTKPRIMVLVLFTAISAMWLAQGGPPDPFLLLYTMIGTALASGSAAALNHYVDRDIDDLMERTQNRAIPAGKVDPLRAQIFGYLLGVLSFVVLVTTVNIMTAFIALGGIFYYVVIYTIWLKRTTPLNIVIGGGSGAVGPLIGWAAVTGTVEIPAILLFSIIFFWTPPHFWSLALVLKDDYEKAKIPMYPVVHGEEKKRNGKSSFIRSFYCYLQPFCIYSEFLVLSI